MHMSLQPWFNNAICGKSTNEGSLISTLKTDYVRSLNKCCFYGVHMCCWMCEMEGICATRRHHFTRMYFWWSLCPLYLPTCLVRVTVSDSCLWCCAHVMSFRC